MRTVRIKISVENSCASQLPFNVINSGLKVSDFWYRNWRLMLWDKRRCKGPGGRMVALLPHQHYSKASWPGGSAIWERKTFNWNLVAPNVKAFDLFHEKASLTITHIVDHKKVIPSLEDRVFDKVSRELKGMDFLSLMPLDTSFYSIFFSHATEMLVDCVLLSIS